MKIISRTPVRINLANGGDTDYYIKETGWGCVINATLSSHFYEVELNENNDFKLDVVDYFDYLDNMNRSYKIDSDFSELELLKACLKELNFSGKNSFVLRTNVPMQSGLGGSSSVAISIVAAIMHRNLVGIEPSKIASLAYCLERNGLNVPGGYQDQYAAAYGGGFNYMEFRPQNSTIANFKQAFVEVENLKLKEDIIRRLENNILLFYLRKRPVSGTEVHKSQEEKARQDPANIREVLIKKRDNALKIKAALIKGNLDEFGLLLRKEGELKNQLSSKISNDYTDKIMNSALNNGALGGKISGAGSGGCMFFYVKEGSKDKLRRILSSYNAIEMNFRFQRGHEPGIMIREIK